MNWSLSVYVVAAIGAIVQSPLTLAGDDPFADIVVSYEQGSAPAPGYTDPTTALGQPERFTGEGVLPGVVSPFNPAFGVDEIVSIGAGGSLVLQFMTPVKDDPCNAFDVDLIVFGNSGFIDSAFPSAMVGGLFEDGGIIEVSNDGRIWHKIVGTAADSLMPTRGYVDAGPYDDSDGTIPTRFTRPMNPFINMGELMGLDWSSISEIYGCSGGGTGIDIGSVGLAEVNYVRISNPAGASLNVEIDAVADASMPADVDADGAVGPSDLAAVLGNWGFVTFGSTPADVDCDGMVGPIDLALVLGCWG